MSVYRIGRVGYVQFNVIVPREEPFQIGSETSLGTSQPFVGVVASACFLVYGLLLEKGFPLGMPVVQCAFK